MRTLKIKVVKFCDWIAYPEENKVKNVHLLKISLLDVKCLGRYKHRYAHMTPLYPSKIELDLKR